ncbi:hypothetical protein J6590_022655 [Homalodisca vitripennis]|nr:hypothetical protein J6590_022655 [Homalodisca vitripennis]
MSVYRDHQKQPKEQQLKIKSTSTMITTSKTMPMKKEKKHLSLLSLRRLVLILSKVSSVTSCSNLNVASEMTTTILLTYLLEESPTVSDVKIDDTVATVVPYCAQSVYSSDGITMSFN